MAVDYELVSVGTSATSLLGSVADAAGPSNARSIKVTNRGAASVFIAGPDVVASAAGGDELAAGESVSLDLGQGDVPYARAASGTVNVGVLHLGV